MFPTFQDRLSVLFPMVKVSNPYHATTQYSKDINYTVAEACHLHSLVWVPLAKAQL